MTGVLSIFNLDESSSGNVECVATIQPPTNTDDDDDDDDGSDDDADGDLPQVRDKARLSVLGKTFRSTVE